MLKNGFESIEDGNIKLWKIIIAVVLIQLFGIIVSHFDLSLINKTTLKIDMILILVFGILFALYKYIKKAKLKSLVVILIFILSTGNIIYNAAFSMKIIREETSQIDQAGYTLAINDYKNIIKFLNEQDNGLYRFEKDLNVSTNDGLVFEYNGVRIFWLGLFKITC